MRDYYDGLMLNRQRLFWAIATRRQLARWEPLVARHVRELLFRKREFPGADIWLAEMEHHFALVAARHLLTALELDPPSTVAIDQTMRAEIIEGRDLHEHWLENLPLFNVRPRRTEPRHRSAKDFAKRHPDRGPYSWLTWNGEEGALLMPNVPALALHELLDAVQAEVIASDPDMEPFVPEPTASPWVLDRGQWWPKP